MDERTDQKTRADGPLSALPPTLTAVVPRLAAGLEVLGDDHHLIVSVDSSRRFVQFAAFGPNLRAETVGNVYLHGPERLTSWELAWLADHGWNDPDEGGNHRRHWEPADPVAAATVALVTLHVVHGVTDVQQLMVDSGDPHVMAELFEARP